MNGEDQHIDFIGLLPAFLSGEATAAEEKAVSEWLAADEENRKTFESFRVLWNLTAPYNKNEIDLDAEWQKMDKIISPAPKLRTGYITVLKIAAMVILISALTFAGFRIAGFKTMRSEATELASYDLPDGTSFSLNADSKVTRMPGFGKTNRNIRLRGEGFFEVSKSSVPFVIETGSAVVTVTGTKFNVSAYPGKGETRVTVTEGSVRLSDTDKPEIQENLLAGETGIYNSYTNVISKAPSDVNALAWKTGIMEFNNTMLGRVTEVLENTYHIPFRIDSAVMKCTITVRFDNQDVDSVLNVLRSTLDLTITHKGKQVLISGDGC